MFSQKRPPFIPEGVVARRKRMELGEPKRRRVGEGAPGLCWSGDRGAWEHNPQGWDPLLGWGTGLPGVEAGFPLEVGAELQVAKGWRGVMPWGWWVPDSSGPGGRKC